MSTMRYGLATTVLALALALAACETVTLKGKNVMLLPDAKSAAGCRFVADVHAGGLFPLASREQVMDGLRNAVAAARGSFLLIDRLHAVRGSDGGVLGFAGTGRAYACPG